MIFCFVCRVILVHIEHVLLCMCQDVLQLGCISTRVQTPLPSWILAREESKSRHMLVSQRGCRAEQ